MYFYFVIYDAKKYVVGCVFLIYSCVHCTTTFCLYEDFERISHYHDLSCVIFWCNEGVVYLSSWI